MAMKQDLNLRQRQALRLTPETLEAIGLLLLSHVELRIWIDNEVGSNPLLVHDDSAGGAKQPAETPTSSAPAQGLASSDWTALRRAGGSFNNVGSGDILDTVRSEETIVDSLTSQLRMATTDRELLRIGEFLIGMVDDRGFISCDLEELTGLLATDQRHIDSALGILQSLEPTGVCARSLEERLTIQLRDRGHFTPAMMALFANLKLVATRKYAALAKICGVSEAEIHGMISEIRCLTRTDFTFGNSPVQLAIPDVHVSGAPDGSWIVELNNETQLRVLINNEYRTVVKSAVREEDRVYFAQCVKRADWVITSLEHRARNILKVACEIVRQQDGFLRHGVEHLRPMTLKVLADMIGVDESTVSRIASNKYMTTPQGNFELKYFFTTALASADVGGEAHSAEAVRHRIKALIDREGPDVLSDDAIVNRLTLAGVQVSRRAVANYRARDLGIPSSNERRRKFLSRSAPNAAQSLGLK
jgi:RNA polymerase sigma-54 factor